MARMYSKKEIERMVDLETFGLLGRQLNLVNPFEIVSRENQNDFSYSVLKLMKQPDFFYFTAKYLYGIELMPYQCTILKELWYKQFPMLLASRGFSKSFLLGIHALNRAIFLPGRKIVITGSGFRQAKMVYQYAEDIYNKSQVLQSLMSFNNKSGSHRDTDRWTLVLGDSQIYCLPIGDGQKIRGQRAHDILSDEFASMNPEIFDSVIRGFGVVNANPFQQVRQQAKIRVLKKIGKWNDNNSENYDGKTIGNQTVLSGTTYYQFNHFYKEWKKYKIYIESKGDPNYIEEHLGKRPPEAFDWKNYVIMRVPVDLLPVGYMSPEQVATIKLSVNSFTYLTEFGSCWISDTDGFYKRSMLEACTTNQPIEVDGQMIQFVAMIKGDFDKQYAMGVDVAAINDNFAIVIVEINKTHRRIVYCWTTNTKEYKKRVRLGLVSEGGDFYSFCGRKIRNLMKVFNIQIIACDAQGGGEAIKGVLANVHYIQEGEFPIYEITEHHPLADGKKKETDDKKGLHILQCVQFSNAEWTSEANHGMKMDFEQRRLLFPRVDSSLIAIEYEKMSEELKLLNKDLGSERYDTLEDCYKELAELKDETSLIEVRPTPTGSREKFDTPETKIAGGKKGRVRKDRYSALLMAETAARHLGGTEAKPDYVAHGGFVGNIKKADANSGNHFYSGPAWLEQGVSQQSHRYGVVVHNYKK